MVLLYFSVESCNAWKSQEGEEEREGIKEPQGETPPKGSSQGEEDLREARLGQRRGSKLGTPKTSGQEGERDRRESNHERKNKC